MEIEMGEDTPASSTKLNVPLVIEELAKDEEELKMLQTFHWISKHNITSSCFEDLMKLNDFISPKYKGKDLRRFKQYCRSALGGIPYNEAIFTINDGEKV